MGKLAQGLSQGQQNGGSDMKYSEAQSKLCLIDNLVYDRLGGRKTVQLQNEGEKKGQLRDEFTN